MTKNKLVQLVSYKYQLEHMRRGTGPLIRGLDYYMSSSCFETTLAFFTQNKGKERENSHQKLKISP